MFPESKKRVVSPESQGAEPAFLNKAVEVRSGLEHVGRGLFAAENIKNGERVFSFNGRFVSREQATDMALQIGEDLFLETDPSVDYENCVNHSCFTKSHKPNCKIRFGFNRPIDSRLIGQRSEVGEVELVAIADIQEGEQLFFDYGSTEENMDDLENGQLCSFDCNCGEECRGHIGGFANLTAEQAKLLYPMMSPHIQKLAVAKFGDGVRGNNFQA